MKQQLKVLQLIIGVITCMIIIMLSKTESNVQSFKVDGVGKGKQSVILKAPTRFLNPNTQNF